ncbi:hypothetical protein ASG68_22640 [Rhizobium sp. Leaf453]|nr:hypothetical protein ASG50_29985 [Rhizobium sp. Leaf386]KQT03215.1 hypothetical protein ASG42_24720 [Rhizobium sp. Leaf391]KQU08390.1 hypothetical protein ASG68_22640 [Rhizobium sp. Leaf453]
MKRARKSEKIAEYEAELALPEFPKDLGFLWSAYNRIRRRKSPLQNGASAPIEWPDIDAFCRNTGMKLDPWQIEVLEDLDNAFLAAK